jgi:hypothetical protein
MGDLLGVTTACVRACERLGRSQSLACQSCTVNIHGHMRAGGRQARSRFPPSPLRGPACSSPCAAAVRVVVLDIQSCRTSAPMSAVMSCQRSHARAARAVSIPCRGGACAWSRAHPELFFRPEGVVWHKAFPPFLVYFEGTWTFFLITRPLSGGGRSDP